jgi:hypothetical protein
MACSLQPHATNCGCLAAVAAGHHVALHASSHHGDIPHLCSITSKDCSISNRDGPMPAAAHTSGDKFDARHADEIGHSTWAG